MIFSTNAEKFYDEESYKERNLYYKIFAGYLFNELVPGEEERKEKFLQFLCDIPSTNENIRVKGDYLDILNKMKKDKIQVTFDYHSCQIVPAHKKNNRGEMSDILLMGSTNFISLECKYLSDMNYEKDIKEVQERIVAVAEKLERNAIQVLLLKKDKWENMKGFEKKSESFYKKFKDSNTRIPVIVLFWEDLSEMIEENIVKNYLDIQLNRKKED